MAADLLQLMNLARVPERRSKKTPKPHNHSGSNPITASLAADLLQLMNVARVTEWRND